MCLDNFMSGESLETDEDSTLIEGHGFPFGVLISKYEEEDFAMVGMSYLKPRAGEILMMQGEGLGWKEVAGPDGDISVRV